MSRLGQCVAGLFGVWVMCVFSPSSALAYTYPWSDVPIFDWWYRSPPGQPTNLVVGISFVPHAGHDYSASNAACINAYTYQFTNNLPVSLILRDTAGPFSGTNEVQRNTLLASLDLVPRLDFAIGSFESLLKYDDTLLMVQQVRAHTNALVNTARIGNYAFFPGSNDVSRPWPHMIVRTNDDTFYLARSLSKNSLVSFE